jgi:phosphoribosylformylglycinamidine cyclo-ligase
MEKKSTYKDSGVDINAADKFVQSLKTLVKPTFRREVLAGIGGFGSLFALNNQKYKEPVLVASTDGVGTKLKIAFMMNKHDTVGIDLVAMCVNDIIVQGAEPLFMLDYISMGRIDNDILVDLVKGMVEGCKDSGCALVGGETAEMPSFYKNGEYDLAGFVVGVVDKDKVIDGSTITVGDTVIGIASSGVHSNGLSLARSILFDKLHLKVTDYVQEFGCTVGEEIIKPTRIYVKAVLNLLRDFQIKGIAHITGGGLVDNIARILPKGCLAQLRGGSWPVPPVFNFLKDRGNVEEEEMMRTFNNGIGLVLVVPPAQEEDVLQRLKAMQQDAYIIGKIESKDRRKKNVTITNLS